VQTTAPAKITSVTINGSVIGNATVGTASNNTGLIDSDGSIGTVRILGVGDTAGLIGGGGTNSGTILANKAIASVTIADSIIGGGGASSGAVISKRNVAAISVGDDVTGGAGAGSGTIQARTLGTATIGDLGVMILSAVLVLLRVPSPSMEPLGALTLQGAITGGEGQNSGGISSGATVTSIVVGGDVIGAGSFHSGYIESQGDIGTVRVLGSVNGGTADRAGSIIAAGSIGRAVVGGKLLGGTGDNSGSIFTGFDPSSPGNLTSLLVKRGVQGGDGISSGSVITGPIGTVQIGTAAAGASVVGGGGDFSGAIISEEGSRP
jgi:hypothetical protein